MESRRPNKNSAKIFTSSVFPTPVGPTPVGTKPRLLVEEDSREVGDASTARALFSDLEAKLMKEPGRRLRLTWRIEQEDGSR